LRRDGCWEKTIDSVSGSPGTIPGCCLAIADSFRLSCDDAWRITTDDLPIPFSPALEDAFLPSADSVAEAVRRRLGVAVAG
jgi:hypothetical protein